MRALKIITFWIFALTLPLWGGTLALINFCRDGYGRKITKRMMLGELWPWE